MARSSPRSTRGQGMTENIIIVALIAIAAIAVVTLFGDNLRSLVGVSADSLSGSTSEGNRGGKSSAGREKKDLSNFSVGGAAERSATPD